MDVFEKMAQPKRRPKLLNSTFHKAKPQPRGETLPYWLQVECEEENEWEENRKVAAEVK